MGYHKTLVVSILAPDGAGKTTLIEELSQNLGSRYRGIIRYHFLTPQSGRRTAHSVSKPHAQAPRSTVVSILKLIYYLTRVWLIRQPEIWSARRKGYLVLIDRDLADVGIDPVRYRVSAPTWVLSLFQRFAPQPDLTLVLNAPPDAVLKRSKELDINTLTSLSAKYKSYAQRAHNAILLDANHPASDVASRASTAILGGKTYAPPQKTN